jgi:L-ascorbate metabolism protein UlaG (beta-lactamase superfamily)
LHIAGDTAVVPTVCSVRHADEERCDDKWNRVRIHLLHWWEETVLSRIQVPLCRAAHRHSDVHIHGPVEGGVGHRSTLLCKRLRRTTT